MENIVLGVIIITIVAFAIGYIVKEKKRGTKCIGCPCSGKSCACQSSDCKIEK